MKAAHIAFFLCSAVHSLRIQTSGVKQLGPVEGDNYLSEESVEQLMKVNPEWDEPFPSDSTTSNIKMAKVRHDPSLMCRKNMRDKLTSLNNSRAILMSKGDFDLGAFVERLPSSGAVLFVVDDAYHSTDLAVRCPKKISSLLDDPRILAVATEDPMCSHSKVHAIPIGIESRLVMGETVRGYGKGYAAFKELMENPVPTNERKHNVQSDGQMHIFAHPKSGYRADRAAMASNVDRGAIDDWYRRHIDLESHFRNHVAQAKLALCPEGNGMDTHRFYHNYALRTRCIVRTGHLSQLHSQFPGTIVVNDWKEVTKENVEKWIKEGDATYDPNLLTSNYWINQFLVPHNIPAVV
jgi:hypothetical protein